MSLLRFKKNQKYLIWDTETESLNLVYSRPWQIAGALYEGNKKLLEFNRHIWWDDLKVSKEAAIITRFNHGKYAKIAEPPKQVWNDVKKYFYDDDILLVGHNILGFDIYQINTWLKNIEEKTDWSFVDRCIDTNCLAKAIELNEEPDRKNFTDWQFKLNSYHQRGLRTSLKMCAKKYAIEYDPDKHHDALYDIELNAKVFLKQIYEIEI